MKTLSEASKGYDDRANIHVEKIEELEYKEVVFD